MQYAMLIYQGEKWAALPREEKNRIHAECGAWHTALEKSGHTRAALGLQPVTTAATVRAAAGEILVTDGPFAETKEVLGGLEVLECVHLDEALAIAGRFPALRAGCAIEIRPLVAGNECKD